MIQFHCERAAHSNQVSSLDADRCRLTKQLRAIQQGHLRKLMTIRCSARAPSAAWCAARPTTTHDPMAWSLARRGAEPTAMGEPSRSYQHRASLVRRH